MRWDTFLERVSRLVAPEAPAAHHATLAATTAGQSYISG